MFGKHNHTFALATAIGSLGGFQQAPDWFKSVSKTSIWQVLMLAVLIYQGGGQLDFTYSISFAILFYLMVSLSGYITFNAVESGDEVESFYGDGDEEDFKVPSLGEEFAQGDESFIVNNHGDEEFTGDEESFIVNNHGDEEFTGDEESFIVNNHGDEENFDVIKDNSLAPENNTEGFANEPVALNESSSTFADFS